MPRKTRPLIIGQAPSKFTAAAKGCRPFSGWSGRRLAEILGLSFAEMHKRIEFRNLLNYFPGRAGAKGDEFPEEEAAASARVLLAAISGRKVILAGRSVAAAFGVPNAYFCETTTVPTGTGVSGAIVGVIPHPSPVNAWYNVPGREKRVRDFVLNFFFSAKDQS